MRLKPKSEGKLRRLGKLWMGPFSSGDAASKYFKHRKQLAKTMGSEQEHFEWLQRGTS